MAGLILVATDGTSASRGAMMLARELQTRGGREVEALGIVEPVPVFDAGFMVALPEVELYESRREALGHEITNQVEEVTGRRDGWSVRAEAGVPGKRIVRRAEEVGAELILMGLGHHRAMDRLFGTETVLQVMQVSHIPVLAVPEGTRTLPSSAVLGVDFSPFSLRAAKSAVSVLAPPWSLHLVHVMSGLEFLPTISEEWRDDYEEELSDRLSQLTRALPLPPGCQVKPEILEGEPARELLAFARNREADLLAAGSHGHGFVGRLLMGSVSTRLVRNAQIPVLVVPPEEPTAELLEIEGKERDEEKRAWVKLLDEFTRSNAGRATTLELHDPELGVQRCGIRFPLWGADYDRKRDRVDIMLGRSGTVEGHLTHSISGPRSIQVETGKDGRARALRVALREGEILLQVHREE